MKPSNYTLSVLVKLTSKARSLAAAFDVVQTLCKEYGFSPNVHVYANLNPACATNRSRKRRAAGSPAPAAGCVHGKVETTCCSLMKTKNRSCRTGSLNIALRRCCE